MIDVPYVFGYALAALSPSTRMSNPMMKLAPMKKGYRIAFRFYFLAC